ncbi:MAG: outer membrane beta-barrel protein [Gemmatimonadales bacterium]|nr:outer membrane beta-barrel protein [Gemmatimonadales bacterium]
MRSAVVAMGLALAIALATPSASNAQRSIDLYGTIGGTTSLSDLNDAGTNSLNTAFTGGGGIGYNLSSRFGVRGDVMYSQPSIDGSGTSGVAPGTDLDRLFYGGEIVWRFANMGSLVPFVGAGGGAVRFEDEAGASFTKGAGRASLGVNYSIPGAKGFGLLAQGTGWVYSFNRAGPSNTQFDVVYSAGVSYAFRL